MKITYTSPMSKLLRVALLGCSLLTFSCFETPKPDCAFACGAGQNCPEGYHCSGDGWCKRDGVADDLSCSSVPLLDAARPDAAVDAMTPDAGDPDAA